MPTLEIPDFFLEVGGLAFKNHLELLYYPFLTGLGTRKCGIKAVNWYYSTIQVLDGYC
ncbi:hypothetical protein NDI44_12250 [Trichocoleus sp. DQ-A3]|uniref:hypothetical protein n=1 Tax=Cyanophyceae TaxID=3028117 RepID=UPI001685438A|nr:hypothetical protein [Coleofasciculus sp. FACHB-125]MBD1899891.1 hypothetical protein [Coleofasciculus sp. FACHB-125]